MTVDEMLKQAKVSVVGSKMPTQSASYGAKTTRPLPAVAAPLNLYSTSLASLALTGVGLAAQLKSLNKGGGEGGEGGEGGLGERGGARGGGLEGGDEGDALVVGTHANNIATILPRGGGGGARCYFSSLRVARVLYAVR